MNLLRKVPTTYNFCVRYTRFPRASSAISTSVVKFQNEPNISRVKDKKTHRYFNEEKVESESDIELPIQFTPTGVHKIRPTFYAPEVDRPKSQNYAFSLSLLMIIVYFFVLREENDIDDAIRGLESQSLYERVQGLEKIDLINYKRYLESRGMSTKEVDQRLKELDEIEDKKETK